MDRRRMVMLFGIAWLSAAALTWFLYAKTKQPRQERRVRIMAATRDMAAGTLVKKTDLKYVMIAERDVPKGAVVADRDALNRVLIYPVAASEPLTIAKLSGPTTVEGISSTIEPGYRAVAVPITDVTGLAGFIQPGSRVDVLFTRPGNMAEAITTTVLQNVKVMTIGRLTQPGQVVDPKAPKVPVATLVVTPADAQKLELAKNQGKISLALRNPLDQTTIEKPGPMTTEALDPMVSARLARARRGRTTNLVAANLDDPKVWQELTGEKKPRDEEKAKAEEEARKRKEAEKPRVVIDVYRGDKHVQELFR
ncbi:MAG: Flp pilus assembly protein CpaB [Bryobacteraceae bacterium]